MKQSTTLKNDNFKTARSHSSWIIEEACELRALLSYDSAQMVSLNKARALSCIDTMKSALNDLEKQINSMVGETAPVRYDNHYMMGDYVLTGVKNAFNTKTSWWLSKRGFTYAVYCFSTYGGPKMQDAELAEKLPHIDGYIALFEASRKQNRKEEEPK